MVHKRNQNQRYIQKKILPALRKSGVIRAGLFGSYARAEEKKNSDIDILIKFKGKKSLFDLIRLEMELEERLGKKVDVVTYASVHPLLKKQILQEELRIL